LKERKEKEEGLMRRQIEAPSFPLKSIFHRPAFKPITVILIPFGISGKLCVLLKMETIWQICTFGREK
jgi:hypothetical protein